MKCSETMVCPHSLSSLNFIQPKWKKGSSMISLALLFDELSICQGFRQFSRYMLPHSWRRVLSECVTCINHIFWYNFLVEHEFTTYLKKSFNKYFQKIVFFSKIHRLNSLIGSMISTNWVFTGSGSLNLVSLNILKKINIYFVYEEFF